MSSFPITDTIYSVGILNPAMRIFDVVMQTEYGTSYNSYLVKGKDKTALIEVCHATFFDQYLKNISEVCDPAEIDYIILNHCEPDHSGALAQLLPHCPNATIVVSRPGSIYLKHITNCDSLRLHIPKDGETLDLGERPLQFISAPFLHWPDSMFTWDETEHTLFSCDFYGAHYCEPYVLDTAMAYPEKYEIALKGYFDAIFGPFISHVRVGLDKSSSLPMERICTSHGPVLTKGCRMERVIALYRAWRKNRH